MKSVLLAMALGVGVVTAVEGGDDGKEPKPSDKTEVRRYDVRGLVAVFPRRRYRALAPRGDLVFTRRVDARRTSRSYFGDDFARQIEAVSEDPSGDSDVEDLAGAVEIFDVWDAPDHELELDGFHESETSGKHSRRRVETSACVSRGVFPSGSHSTFGPSSTSTRDSTGAISGSMASTTVRVRRRLRFFVTRSTEKFRRKASSGAV